MTTPTLRMEPIEAIKASIRVFIEELCDTNLNGRRIRNSLKILITGMSTPSILRKIDVLRQPKYVLTMYRSGQRRQWSNQVCSKLQLSTSSRPLRNQKQWSLTPFQKWRIFGKSDRTLMKLQSTDINRWLHKKGGFSYQRIIFSHVVSVSIEDELKWTANNEDHNECFELSMVDHLVSTDPDPVGLSQD